MSERSLGSVVIALKAVDEVSSVMDKIRASTGILGGALSQLGGGFGAVGNVITGFAGAGVAGAAIAALGEVAQGLQWSVKEATDSQQAFTNLATAVERSGTAWTDVEGKTRQYLSQLQSTTVYSDEALAGMVERLLTFGMTYEQAMSAAGTALDLAAAKHMDLQSASDLLGKAFMGNTAILKRYGIDVSDVGGKAATFTDIMGKLNEQFGGAAQAQAQTYAGIQERLKNATSELGEKIGGILLPGLASVTEAMIPVVDWFGKGIDGIQAWLTEVGKMPEVQGIMAAVNEAFKGFWSYLNDLWKFIQDTFGPALQELWSAFKELWNALSPIGDALKELLAVFGDVDNIDLLKIVLQGIVLQIRAVAEIIKEVSPYIKTFANTFREAADFIAPILMQIVGAVRTFVYELQVVFQGFYNWLVGASLWVDLWNAVLEIAGRMIAQLLTDLNVKMFTPMQVAFTTAMQVLQNVWALGWDGVQGTLNNAISAMQGAWSGFAGFISQGIGQLQGALSTAQTSVASTVSSMQTAAGSAASSIQSAFSSAWNGITSGTQWLWNTLVGGSIWTDLMETMQSQAYDAVGNIAGAFRDMSLTVPDIMPYSSGALSAPSAAPASATSAVPSLVAQQSITIPITVTLDGKIISQYVEKRLAERRQLRERSFGRF